MACMFRIVQNYCIIIYIFWNKRRKKSQPLISVVHIYITTSVICHNLSLNILWHALVGA